MIPDAAPPTYDEYVGASPEPPQASGNPTQWALAACAADPAMRRAFLEAGASRGWVGGAKVRRYCEREGLMRSGEGGPGVAKGVLASAWELADAKKDARGLSFDEFCVFMHLLCIATAGGNLPKVLPLELVPPSTYGVDYDWDAPAAAPPPPPPPPAPETGDDEALARSLQETFDEEQRAEAPPHPNDRLPTAAAEPPVRQAVLEERAYEHERLASNGHYSAAHLIPGADPSPWKADVPSGVFGDPVAASIQSQTRGDLETQLALLRPWGRGAWRVVEHWHYGDRFDRLDGSSGPCRRRTWARECREMGAGPGAAPRPPGDDDDAAGVPLGDGSSLAPRALRSLLLSQGGVLELGRTLYACDEALENERWLPGGHGFSPAHLLPTDVGPWSSLDGSLCGPDRLTVAPPRDAEAWTLVSEWRAHVDASSTDRRGWTYARELPSPNHVGAAPIEGASQPFAGALARRRRWVVVYSRPLARPPPAELAPRPGAAPLARPPPAFLARLQDSFRLGVHELNRRLGAVDERPRFRRASDATPDDSSFAARWDQPAANRCRASLNAFVRNFGKHETPGTSDEARAARVKRFVNHAARLLRGQAPWNAESPEDFELTVDHLEAMLYTALARGSPPEPGFRLICEADADDDALARRFSAFHGALTCRMLDAPDVARFEAFGRALAALNLVPDESTPRRATKRIREAVDCLFECLAALAREAGGDGADVVPGADDLLPVVIFATLKARPRRLHAALKFVELYSSEDKMRGEAGFLLTQLSAAAAFLTTLGADQLRGVDETAFRELLAGERRTLADPEIRVDVHEADDGEADEVKGSLPGPVAPALDGAEAKGGGATDDEAEGDVADEAKGVVDDAGADAADEVEADAAADEVEADAADEVRDVAVEDEVEDVAVEDEATASTPTDDDDGDETPLALNRPS